MMIVLLYQAADILGDNYPILALETLSTVSGRIRRKSGLEYSLMGTLLNHGAPGEFIIRVYVFEDGNWKNEIVYGPLYINDKAEFNITWYTYYMRYQEKIRAEFYAIKRNGDLKKEFTIEF